METKKKTIHYSLLVIREVLEEIRAGHSPTEVGLKRGINRKTISRWVRQYGYNGVVEKVRHSFTDQQKRVTVMKIQDGEMTIREASLAHQTSSSTIKNWLTKSEAGIADIQEKQSTMPVTAEVASEELQKARLKILALETMIDVAETEFKIKIRKKPGARQ